MDRQLETDNTSIGDILAEAYATLGLETTFADQVVNDAAENATFYVAEPPQCQKYPSTVTVDFDDGSRKEYRMQEGNKEKAKNNVLESLKVKVKDSNTTHEQSYQALTAIHSLL